MFFKVKDAPTKTCSADLYRCIIRKVRCPLQQTHCKGNLNFRTPPRKAIADFLLYLFHHRKLQLCTIEGYRSAIADKLGNSPINVSKDGNFTHILDIFHRDRSKGWTGIPYWKLSLVLHQLTKAPFGPLKEASLKHLTFNTVFLLTLGSGKHRRSMTGYKGHQTPVRLWSRVSLYPSPSFLSKNQLANEGPDNVAPVVIPALATTLDKSLKGDRSLCLSYCPLEVYSFGGLELIPFFPYLRADLKKGQ